MNSAGYHLLDYGHLAILCRIEANPVFTSFQVGP